MSINKAYEKNNPDIVYNKKNSLFNKSLKGKRIIFITIALLTITVLLTTFIIKSKSYGLWNTSINQESTNHMTITDNKLSIMQNQPFADSNGIGKYKSSITKLIFENNIHDIENKIETFDISEEKNESVIAHVVANDDNSTHTAYIQGKRKIIATTDCSYIFAGLNDLIAIEGLEYFDTHQVTNMSFMFSECSSLTILDLSNFNTSNVENMWAMFSKCSSLESLNLSSFDTTSVTKMSEMFCNCSILNTITYGEKFIYNNADVNYMFLNCPANKPTNSSWDTVTF